MAESKTWSWIKSHAVAILVPLASGAIALAVSYGANIRDETVLLNRVGNLEAQVATLTADNSNLNQEVEDLEDSLRDADAVIRDLMIKEGRDLERTLIRIEGRVDSINRRLTFIDGIGGPTYYGPQPNFNFVEPSEAGPTVE